jgi:hypothetical protein
MSLQSDDHYVLRKLNNELLPWLIGGRRTARQKFVYLASVYAYGGEFATALAGIGIGTPVVALFRGKTADGSNAFTTLRNTLPGVWFWIGVLALALWLILRLVVKQQNAVDRRLYARDCGKTMQRLELDLQSALADPNPLQKIGPIQEAVMRAVHEAVEKDVWPWRPPLPRAQEIDAELSSRIDDIRATFMSAWAPSPAGVT